MPRSPKRKRRWFTKRSLNTVRWEEVLQKCIRRRQAPLVGIEEKAEDKLLTIKSRKQAWLDAPDSLLQDKRTLSPKFRRNLPDKPERCANTIDGMTKRNLWAAIKEWGEMLEEPEGWLQGKSPEEINFHSSFSTSIRGLEEWEKDPMVNSFGLEEEDTEVASLFKPNTPCRTNSASISEAINIHSVLESLSPISLFAKSRPASNLLDSTETD